MGYENVESIMILGDSISRGVVLNEGKGRYFFSAVRFLNRIAKTIFPKLLDHSKFGATTRYGLKTLDKRLRSEKPDLVLIEYGSNDSDYDWDEVQKAPRAQHLPHLSLKEYTKNLANLITRVREAGAIPVMTNLHPLVPERYFNWFTRGDPARQERTMLWLKNTRNIYWWQEMYSYAAERTGKEEGIPVLDIRGAFLRSGDYAALMCEDGIHPNEDGHALIYEVLMHYIRKSAASWTDLSHGSASTTNP